MHTPVLLKEILALAGPVEPREILDATFGRGGHTRAFLDLSTKPRVTALDQDLAAITHGQTVFASEIAGGRLNLIHANFHDLASLTLPTREFDFILVDLGVSSPQLDEPERGFSFYHDGPLDMRMDQGRGMTAAQIVNTWPDVQLLSLFQRLGEIRRPHRVVMAIVEDRKTELFTRTRQLAELIERVEGWRKKGHHPATTYFLALRMAVNNEIEGLSECVGEFASLLSPKGRLAIITFHSLEDRIIKYAFRENPQLGFPLFKKVIVPSPEEMQDNPRSRSAKLRVFQRGLKDEATRAQ